MYRQLHRKDINEYQQKYRIKNKERCKLQSKAIRFNLKMEVFSHYSNPIKCACCGEYSMEFLTLDHINGGGTKDRKIHGLGNSFYKWIKNDGFPKGFQILCMNCNFAKRFGECPHKRSINIGYKGKSSYGL